MTTLQARQVRSAWHWCRAYTAFAPPAARARRRGEILSHLWEAEAVGLPPGRIFSSAARGAVSDLVWVVATDARSAVAAVAAPMTWVVAALAFPLLGWFMSGTQNLAVAHVFESIGAFGGGGMLAVAGVIALLRRPRR
jgi:hypothetical protein